MAGLNPLEAIGQRPVCVGANRDRLLDCEVRNRPGCRRHRRSGLADGDDVQPTAGEHCRQRRIREGTIDDPRGTDRVDTGADDGVQVLLERYERNRQWTLQGSDQPDRPVTTSNSRSNWEMT